MARLRYGPRFGSSVAQAREVRPRVYTSPYFRNAGPEKRADWAFKANSAKRNKHVSLAGQAQPAFVDERAEAQERMIERLERCVELMVFGIEELIAAPPPRKKHGDESDRHMLNISYMIDLVNKLATAARLPEPRFNVVRRSGQSSRRQIVCIDCGVQLGADEFGMYCNDCAPDLSDAHAMREDMEVAEQTLKRLEKNTRHLARMEKEPCHDPEGHARNQDEDAGVVAPGGNQADRSN